MSMTKYIYGWREGDDHPLYDDMDPEDVGTEEGRLFDEDGFAIAFGLHDEAPEPTPAIKVIIRPDISEADALELLKRSVRYLERDGFKCLEEAAQLERLYNEPSANETPL